MKSILLLWSVLFSTAMLWGAEVTAKWSGTIKTDTGQTFPFYLNAVDRMICPISDGFGGSSALLVTENITPAFRGTHITSAQESRGPVRLFLLSSRASHRIQHSRFQQVESGAPKHLPFDQL